MKNKRTFDQSRRAFFIPGSADRAGGRSAHHSRRPFLETRKASHETRRAFRGARRGRSSRSKGGEVRSNDGREMRSDERSRSAARTVGREVVESLSKGDLLSPTCRAPATSAVRTMTTAGTSLAERPPRLSLSLPARPGPRGARRLRTQEASRTPVRDWPGSRTSCVPTG